MKFIKILIVMIFLALIPFSVNAETEDFYKQQYEKSGVEKIEDSLPDAAKEYFSENDINPSDYNWVNTLSAENVFRHIFNFFKSGMKTPFRAAAGIIGIILIAAALNATQNADGASKAAVYASAVASAAVIAAPVFSVITASVNAVKGIGVFMLGFIPIFAVIIAASGSAVTSVSMSALLLTAAEGVSYVSGFVVLPLMGGYLALGISSSVSPLIKKSGIAEYIKKVTFWIMAFISTVFVGILTIQTAVNSSADSLTVKTAKFIIGSSVPVAGGALSEALNTVTASMGLLKSSIGIYGVVVCFAALLPLVAELLIWRAVLMLSSSAAELFSLPEISALLKTVDSMMSVLIGVILLSGALFIISLTVVITAGKVQ